MSGIRSPQRRALEALIKSGPLDEEIVVGGVRRYFLEGKEIFLCGVSKGIGACSDLHGVNIAVFSSQDPEREMLDTLCSAAAFLRNPLAQECKDDGIARQVVEDIFFVPINNGVCSFMRSGRKEIYVNTIC